MDQSTTPLNARQWSASVLGVDANCQIAELLWRLTDEDYVVPATDADAMQVLVNPRAPFLRADAIPLATEAGTRERMEVAVTGFANSFFEIPAYRRQEQWRALHNDCQPLPELTHWLNNLEPALDASIPEIGDDAIDTFVSRCCQSFVARGAERARRRQAIYQLYCDDPHAWQVHVEYLQAYHADFVARLAPWIQKLQGIYFSELAKDAPLPVLAVATGTRPPKATESNWWGWLVAISIVSAVIRGIASNSSPPPSNSKIKWPVESNVEWKVDNPKDQAALSAELAIEIIKRRRKGSRITPQELINERNRGVEERPADALKPANQSLPVYSEFQ